jgi:hypothetical protein
MSTARLRKLVMELRRQLADAAFEASYRRLRERNRREKRRPRYKLVKVLPSVRVRMDGTKNHGRPHVHLDIGKEKHAASIAIDNREVLVGTCTLTTTQLREVQGWIQRHERALERLWNEMQTGGPGVEALICELQEEEDPRRSISRTLSAPRA